MLFLLKQMKLLKYLFFSFIFLAATLNCAMDNQPEKSGNMNQSQEMKPAARERQVSFSVPVDDRLRVQEDQDTQQQDEPHRPMKRPSKKTKKSYLFPGVLSLSDDASYWNKFMGCLCRLAHAEFDENNFYPSLRD